MHYTKNQLLAMKKKGYDVVVTIGDNPPICAKSVHVGILLRTLYPNERIQRVDRIADLLA